MNASIGDRLVIRGHRIGSHERTATIVDVRGPDGGPPYLVRWDDPRGGDEEHLFFPGSDADVQHHPPSTSP